ncbi:MAG: hypothetical protein AAFV53_24720 [Myxococcota bacterium]
MIGFLLTIATVQVADAAEPLPVDALVESISTAPTARQREALFSEALARYADDANAVAQLSNGLATMRALDAAQRTDPSLLRLFLMAAMSSDAPLRTQAITAATIGGDPPLSAPQPITDPRAQERYDRQRLRRDRLTVTSGYYSIYGGSISTYDTWSVYDGGGKPYTVREFAETVGDQRMIRRLKGKTRRAVLTTAAGTGAMILGFGIAFSEYSNADNTNGIEEDDLDSGRFLTWSLIGTAGMGTAMIAGIVPPIRRRYVSLFYEAHEADQLIDSYNERLRQDLGVTHTSRRPAVELTPTIGLAYIGLNGRF